MARPPRSASPAPAAEALGVGAWFRNLQLSGFTVTVFLLIVAGLVVLAPSLRILVEQRQEIAELERTVAEQQAAVEDLEVEIDRWQDPAYIEAQARGRLLYVYPGDISYLVIDDGLTPPSDDGQPISDEIQTTRVDWTRALLSSFVTAGSIDRASR